VCGVGGVVVCGDVVGVWCVEVCVVCGGVCGVWCVVVCGVGGVAVWYVVVCTYQQSLNICVSGNQIWCYWRRGVCQRIW
jgi:hypothetical protein